MFAFSTSTTLLEKLEQEFARNQNLLIEANKIKKAVDFEAKLEGLKADNPSGTYLLAKLGELVTEQKKVLDRDKAVEAVEAAAKFIVVISVWAGLIWAATRS